MDNTVLFFVILVGALVIAYYTFDNESKGSPGNTQTTKVRPTQNPNATTTTHGTTTHSGHPLAYCERMCGGNPTAVSKDGSYYEIHGDRCSDHVTKLVCKDPATPFVPKIEQTCVADCGGDNGYLLPSCSGSGRCTSHDGVAPYPMSIALNGRCTNPCPR